MIAADVVETASMGDGSFLEVVHVEDSSSAANDDDGPTIVAPDVLGAVEGAEVGPLLLLTFFAWEPLVLKRSMPGLSSGEETRRCL